MSSMETPNESIQPNPETPADSTQERARQVFIGFAATIIIGLTLAGWYVGGRIFAAEKVHAATIVKPVVATPVATPTPSLTVIEEPVEADETAEPVAIPSEQPKPDAAAGVQAQSADVHADPAGVQAKPADAAPAWNTVDPQSGELYLQLAAMGPNSTNDYLKTLEAKGIHPRIAPGPSDSLHRLVIGPYPDRASLEKEQKELEAAGIQFMARRY